MRIANFRFDKKISVVLFSLLIISISSAGIQYTPDNLAFTENEHSLAYAKKDNGGGGGGNSGGNSGGKDKSSGDSGGDDSDSTDDSSDGSGEESDETEDESSDKSEDESDDSFDDESENGSDEKDKKNKKVKDEFDSTDEFEEESESKDEFEDSDEFADEDNFEDESEIEEKGSSGKEKKEKQKDEFESEDDFEDELDDESDNDGKNKKVKDGFESEDESADEPEEEYDDESDDKEKKEKQEKQEETVEEESEGESKEDDKKKENKYESEEIEAPDLEGETLDKWIKEFKATKIEDGKEATIDEPEDLPPVIVADKENEEEIKEAVEEQETVQLDVAFAELTDGSDIIETFDLPTYDLPDKADVVAIVPPVATTVDPDVGQTVSTPPLDKIVPGQKIIVPVDQEVIADFGGLLQLDVEPAEDAQAVGEIEEWFVVATNDKIPSTIPTLEESGIENKVDLFIDVSYPFEETGGGFDWADPKTHAKPVEFQFLIDKPDPYKEQVVTVAGCPSVEIFVLDETTDMPVWTTEGVRVVSVTPSGPSCKVSAESEHLSKFAIGGLIRPALVVGGAEEQKNGCLIATAAFGSELAPQVQLLRETRDNVVLHTQSGTTFMAAFNSVYYTFAPTVADWERENTVFKEIVKITITPLVTTLSILNYVNIDSEAEMLGYGIAVILLNMGMYLALPIFGIVRLKRYFKT